MKKPSAFIFDVFGTCVDWRGGIAREAGSRFAKLGIEADPLAFADAWRAEYQPAMERIRSGGRGYVDLDDLHLENLEIVLERFGLSECFDDAARADFNHAWEKLPPWPDVAKGLQAIREQATIAPCSNGSIALMTGLARFAGLPWDCILGAAIARDYKPKPAVYLATCRALRLSPHDVMMVAAHNDDLAAAHACGLQTAFVPRPTEHGSNQLSECEPTGDWTIVAHDFPQLCERISRSRSRPR